MRQSRQLTSAQHGTIIYGDKWERLNNGDFRGPSRIMIKKDQRLTDCRMLDLVHIQREEPADAQQAEMMTITAAATATSSEAAETVATRRDDETSAEAET